MGACDLPLMSTVCDAVSGVVSSTGQAVTDGIGAWLAKSAGDLAASAADLAAKAVDETTAINLNASWFRNDYQLLLPIGLALIVGTFCLQLAGAAWRRDERALARAAVGTMTGVLFSFCAVALTSVAITVVDAVSDGLFRAADTSVGDTVRRVIEVNAIGVLYSLGWGVPAVVALGCALGAFLYWGVMVARKVGILVMVALAPFAGSGGGWDAAKRWRRGWIEATATLVVSKLLMTVVFLIGVSAMGKSDIHDGLSVLSDALAGLLIMVLALLCPYATYRFIHWATDGSHDDLHRAGVSGPAVAAGAAKTSAGLAVRARTGAPAPQGPSTVPGMGPDGVASGIDPAGACLSKEGISGTPRPQTGFRYGENPGASGDRGRALVRRPGIPPLVNRPTDGTADGAKGRVSAADERLGDGPFEHFGTAAPSGPAPEGTPLSSGPSATGSPTPPSWVFPDQPPPGS